MEDSVKNSLTAHHSLWFKNLSLKKYVGRNQVTMQKTEVVSIEV